MTSSRRFVLHRSTQGDGEGFDIRPAWNRHAPCNGISDWFDSQPKALRAAIHQEQQALCATCPVIVECATDATSQGYDIVPGVWAGIIVPGRTGKGMKNARLALEQIAGTRRACGTWRGDATHKAAGEPSCDACIEARARKNLLSAESKARVKARRVS